MTLRVSPVQLVEMAEASGHPGLLGRAPGWSRIRLGDIARIINGAAFSSRSFNREGRGLPLVRIRDVGSNRTDTYYEGPYDEVHLLQHGDVVVGMDGDFRVARWRGGTALLNQRVCKIEVDESRYNGQFLVLVLQGYLDAIWKATSSVTVKHLSSRSIADIPLPCPSIREQRRIVEILEDHLSRLDAAYDLLHSAVGRWEPLWRRAVESELTGRRVDGVRESPRPPAEGVDDGELPSLPAGWAWMRLCDVADVVGGVTKDARKQGDRTYIEVPYLRVANVQRGALDLSEVTTIRVPPSTAAKLRLLPGDVLLNEGGDRDKLGRGWVWEGQIDGCIHQNHVFRARVRDAAIDPYLLSWSANTIGGRWCERNGRQSVNLASISLSKIKLMPVPVPPSAEQPAIVIRLRALAEAGDNLQSDLRAFAARAAALRRSLLSAAFSGRLTHTRAQDLVHV